MLASSCEQLSRFGEAAGIEPVRIARMRFLNHDGRLRGCVQSLGLGRDGACHMGAPPRGLIGECDINR